MIVVGQALQSDRFLTPAHSIVAAERQNREGAVQNRFHCQCTPTVVSTELRGRMPEFKRGPRWRRAALKRSPP
jgi:hypothetical protein